jgi:hypothetical protein
MAPPQVRLILIPRIPLAPKLLRLGRCSALLFLLSSTLALPEPVNVALNKPARADSTYTSSFPASNAFDGDSSNNASRWLSDGSLPPHWIEVDLGQTYRLSRMKFWTGHSTGKFPLDDYALQYWNGAGWTDLYSTVASADDDGAVDVGFGPTLSGNRVRLHITAVDPANADMIVRLYELELYGEPHGLQYAGLQPTASSVGASTGASVGVSFDQAVVMVDANGIRVENLTTASDAAGISASVDGDTLIIGHSGLADDSLYAVHVSAGAVAAVGDPTLLNGSLYWEFTTGQPGGGGTYLEGTHPRLFFDEEELEQIRGRLDREPYAGMYAALVANRQTGDFYRPTNTGSADSLLMRAQGAAFLHALSQDESYAQLAREDVLAAWGMIGDAWLASNTSGLTLYSRATRLAMIYDLCFSSAAWDDEINEEASLRLRDLAMLIIDEGGTGQPTDPGNNWHAGRGASAGLALLATDHSFDATQATDAHQRVENYLNANQGPGDSKGWNPEGFGYTAYPIGSFAGPYAVAIARRDPALDLRSHQGLQWMAWTGFAGATTALDVYGTGGVKTDWSDDNAHVGGEGIYGLAFFLSPESIKPGLKHAYDRFMGALSPLGANWDSVRHGSFWSILFYPEDVVSQDPTEIWDWHRASDSSGGIGKYTFRNVYEDSHDILIQFKARLRTTSQGHDGPDGLGFRVIGLGDPLVIGGGRNGSLGKQNQPTVYPSLPGPGTVNNRELGTLTGSPLVKPDGGGHAIASMPLSSVGTVNHKRWFVVDYDKAATGADATIIVADSSTNGLYWQLPTFLNNAISHSGNTFTVTGTNGATMRGSIIHPGGNPAVTVGTRARGDGYTLSNGGTLATENPSTNPRITQNRYLLIQGNGDGDFLVVMTLQAAGAHPDVSRLSGAVADAVVQVGTRQYALQENTVHYDGATYNAPAAVVVFDAAGKGALGGAHQQTVSYGNGAFAPVVEADAGYVFIGWDKAFSQVVKSMTVSALYAQSEAISYANWISGDPYGLDLADQAANADPDGDGLVNLLEYAFVLNPAIPDNHGAISLRTEAGNLIIRYPVRAGADDISVIPFYSATMAAGSWIQVPEANIQYIGSAGGADVFEASMPVVPGSLFLRLEVRQVF